MSKTNTKFMCIELVWLAFALFAAIVGRLMIALDIINMPHTFWVDVAICILFIIVIFLFFRNKVDENSVQPIIAVAGIIMLVTFIGVMIFGSISGVSQELFGVEKSTGNSPSPKNAALEFIGLGIGGIIAVYGLIAFNKRAIAQIKQNELQIKQNDLTKIGLSQERFKAAVEHLSNTKSGSGRIASFYEFYYLAKDAEGNKDDYAQTSPQTILDILCAHLRLIAGTEEDVTTDDKNPKHLKEEVNSLIGVLFSREAEDVFGGLNYDLQRVNLTEVDFRKMHNPKANVDFSDAILNKAIFINTDLSHFILQKTELQGADFQDANLQGTNFQGAKLQGANFQGAKNLQPDKLNDAEYDAETEFPDDLPVPDNR